MRDARRVGDEPDPRDVYGHPVRYRVRSRRSGIDIGLEVRAERGTLIVQTLYVRSTGAR